MNNQIPLKTYREILQELESNSNESHLLLGNGFNASLGIETSYEDIFKEMKDDYAEYGEVENILSEYDYDIEFLIRHLTGKIKKDKTEESIFLEQYLTRKIKLDFMKAAYSIVKDKIRGIYKEKNQRIYLLLKNFTNYFTLNHDPFLYFLLMKFKKDDEDKAIAFQRAPLFPEEVLNQTQNYIYHEIKEARQKGWSTVVVEGSRTEKALSQCRKTEFTDAVKNHFKDRNWKGKDIKKAVDFLWKEENQQSSLPIRDGFIDNIYDRKMLEKQNLFFIHGAFHIYQDNRLIRKITQSQDKALYERLEKIINAEEKEIVCILAGTSQEKMESIDNNDYLKRSLEKLSVLDGSLVVLGSSLDENDRHVFEAINKSKISSIYISSCKKDISEDSRKARDIFPKKKILLFDYETISYEDI